MSSLAVCKGGSERSFGMLWETVVVTWLIADTEVSKENHESSFRFFWPTQHAEQSCYKYYCGGVCELSGMGCTSRPQGLQFEARIREVMCAYLVRKVTGLQTK